MSDTEARIAKLEAEIAELKRASKPPAPLDLKGGASGPTTTQIALNGLGMSPQVLRDHVAAVPSGVVREVVGDGPVGSLRPAGAEGSARPSVAQLNTSGWRTAPPLSAPEGVARADRLMDAAARADRVELAQRLARQRVAEGAEGKG
jgi:hypothetical protein